jgi:hypothetical protein
VPKEIQSLDDLVFSGDKHLDKEAKEQLDRLYEKEVVETILSFYGVPKSQAYNWNESRHGVRAATCECLPELAPDFPHRISTARLKYDTKRVTSFTYEKIETSVIGETVAFHGADNEPFWIVSNIPFMPGHIVMGKREFPLRIPFTGHVVSGDDDQCYLFCPLRSFLLSGFCKKPF